MLLNPTCWQMLKARSEAFANEYGLLKNGLEALLERHPLHTQQLLVEQGRVEGLLENDAGAPPSSVSTMMTTTSPIMRFLKGEAMRSFICEAESFQLTRWPYLKAQLKNLQTARACMWSPI